MDCNKDEALRAKEIAERKFAEGDYNGAKKFAQKARQLCPGLNFISLFITIIDIYCSRENIRDGQPDWHRVLGVERPTNLEKICESYCNLAHAVKAGINNVVGAEGAFQILSDAWCMLSESFWTKCSRCCFHFQYALGRLKKQLVCKNCGGKGVLKHSKRIKNDDDESSNKAPKVGGHEAGLIPGASSASPSVDGKGTLKRCKRAEKDAMKLPSSDIQGMLMHK